MKLKLYCLIGLSLTACSGPTIKPLSENSHPTPSAVLSPLPSLEPVTVTLVQSPIPSAFASSTNGIDDFGKRFWAEYWQRKAKELIEVKKQALVLNEPLEQLKEVKKDQPLYFLLPKVKGVQQLLVFMDEWTRIEVYEDRSHEGEEDPGSFYGPYRCGVYFLRTDLYDTYLVIKTSDTNAQNGSFRLQASQPKIKDQALAYFGNNYYGFEGMPYSGNVYDEEGYGLPGVLIQAQGTTIPFFAEVRSDPTGAFKFENLPHSVQIRFDAIKQGYSPRFNYHVLPDPNVDPRRERDISFGVPKTRVEKAYPDYSALSDKPEITDFEPGFSRDAEAFMPGKIDNLSPVFTFRFMKAIQPSSFIDDFQIKAFTLKQRQTISQQVSESEHKRWEYAQKLMDVPVVAIADDFIINWNQDFTEVKLKLKPGVILPKPINPEYGPHFQVDFGRGDQTLISKDGLSRKQDYIKYAGIRTPYETWAYVSNYLLNYVGF